MQAKVKSSDKPKKSNAKSSKRKTTRKKIERDRAFEQVRRRAKTPYRDPAPLYGATRVSEALFPEEEMLARSLADELNYAAAIVATELDGCYPEKSAAGTVQKLLRKKSARAQKQAQRRARAMLSQDPSERRKTFGGYALAGSREKLNSAGLTDEQRGLLREIVRKRGQAQQSELHSLNEFIGTGGIGIYNVCKSELEGIISEELNEYFTQKSISSPEVVKLRWNTECEEAEVGIWEVLRLPSQSVVASGTVGVNLTFQIDFGQFLSLPAPVNSQNYKIRIRPHAAAKFEKVPGATPDSTTVVKIPAKPLAGYSNAVFIAYQLDESEQKFEEDIIYRNAELHIDHLHMVEQQSGLGADEYWLHGSLIETGGEEHAVAHELQKWFAELDGDNNKHVINYNKKFHLENPSSTRWPKTYTLLLTVFEEDGGEDIAETMQDIWNWVSGKLLSEIFDEVKGFLSKIGLEPWSAGAIAAALAGLAAALAGSVLGAIAGLVLSLAAGFIQIIAQAVEDDFFETKSVVLALPTNTEDYVHQQVEGVQNGDRFVLKAQYPQFRHWTVKSLGAYDGLVEVKVHWELTNPEDLALG